MLRPSILAVYAYLILQSAHSALGTGHRWHFVQNGTSGVLALETIFISQTLALFFNSASQDPLMIDGHSAWGALWNIETNKPTAIRVRSDSFCASGAMLSNGTMVSLGGNTPYENSQQVPDGRMALRLFEPCYHPAGINCTLIERPDLVLSKNRWYPSSLRIFDGSLMVIGGTGVSTPFYNDLEPINSYEFFPKKDGGVPRPSKFLKRTLPANLFPRGFALPDGKVLIIANNQTIIYDVEKNEEIRLPDIPNGVRVTNPFDGTATLLPLSPPLYIPEVLVCGGSNKSDQTPPLRLSSQDPASDQCSRLTLTRKGIRRGWQVEKMLEGRMVPEMILLPNGQVLITGGAKTGYAAVSSVSRPINGHSNADHAVLTPSLYTPSAPVGHRISNIDMPTTNIARVYHSSASLTPHGNVLIAGSNPNVGVFKAPEYKFPTEYRVEYLNPPYMTMARPVISNVPKKIQFQTKFSVTLTVPPATGPAKIKIALMDLGFSTHAFHSSSRLVFLEYSQKSPTELVIHAPPNNRVFPPGPGYIFITVGDVTSRGVFVMVGSGASPPVRDQGADIRNYFDDY